MTPHPRLKAVIDWAGRNRNALTAGFMLLVIGIAAFALTRILREVTLADIVAALDALTWRHLIASVALTAVSYLVLTGYDVLATRAIGKPQPWWRCALASFTSYTASHNLGFAPVTATAARWRAYRGTTIGLPDVARIVVIAGVTFWLGIFLLLGLALVAQPGALRVHDWTLAYGWQAALGLAVLVGIAAYLRVCARGRGPLNILGWTLPVPTPRQALAQFGLAAIDITVASAALLVLVPQAEAGHFPLFLTAYVVAVVVALLTHAPGGLGVFEAVMLVALPQVDKATLAGALIVYRAVYYLAPLALAMLLLAAVELLRARRSASIQRPAATPASVPFDS